MKFKYVFYIKDNIVDKITYSDYYLYDFINLCHSPYTGKNKQEIFYYVDNAHITGVNIPFTSKSHCLVTTNKFTTLRDLFQGIYRLRDIDISQKITLIYSFNTIDTIDKTMNNINKTMNNINKTMNNNVKQIDKQNNIDILINIYNHFLQNENIQFSSNNDKFDYLIELNKKRDLSKRTLNSYNINLYTETNMYVYTYEELTDMNMNSNNKNKSKNNSNIKSKQTHKVLNKQNNKENNTNLNMNMNTKLEIKKQQNAVIKYNKNIDPYYFNDMMFIYSDIYDEYNINNKHNINNINNMENEESDDDSDEDMYGANSSVFKKISTNKISTNKIPE